MANFNSQDLFEARTYLEQAVALFRELDDRQGLASSLPTLMLSAPSYFTELSVTASAGLSETLSLVREGEAALQIARDIGYRSGEAYAMIELTNCLGALGEYARALAHGQEGLRVAEEIEHRQWTTGGHCMLGQLYLDILALPTAQDHLEQAVALAQAIGSQIWLPIAVAALTPVYTLQREFARAESVLAPTLDAQTSAQRTVGRLCWCARAELDLARGAPDRALDIADQLIAAITTASGARVIPRLWKLRGEALAALGRADEAEAVLRSAQEAAQTHGLRPQLWRIHVALSQLYRGQGRSDEAAREFSAARTLIQELAAGLPYPPLRQNFLRQALALVSA
jgi:tetratricopeptide (TPR) repeat protein